MKKSCLLFMFFLGLWLGLTCFLDFFAVPTIFRTLSSRQDAGGLGMILFLAFNRLEILLSIILASCAWFFRSSIKWKKTFWATMAFLFILANVYTFHMSPTIINANKEKYELFEGTPEYQKLDEIHQQYHGLFRKTDGLKILILLTLLGSALKGANRLGCSISEEQA